MVAVVLEFGELLGEWGGGDVNGVELEDWLGPGEFVHVGEEEV